MGSSPRPDCRAAVEQKALVIEDERDINSLVALHLRDLGLQVAQCFDGTSGLDRATHNRWALIVLDLSLPELDGIDVCRRLRGRHIYTPLLMLTARGSEHERAAGLDAGADDYLAKPFGVLEFIARAKALLRRARLFSGESQIALRILRVGDIEIDLEKRTVFKDWKPVDLTAREFDLLSHFATHSGRVFSRAQLLDQVWGSTHDAFEHAVSSHINRLRAKIEPDPENPRYLVTVWGTGYRLDAPQ
jgi:DNA-binding response OmpR family regulator